MPPAAASGSSSAIIGSAKSSYHVLKIQGYSTTKATVPNGRYIESCPFRAAGRTWAIRYYPNGDRPESSEYVSLHLQLKDHVSGDGVMARLCFSFIDQVEWQVPSHVRARTANRFLMNTCWGRSTFIKHETLEQSDLGRLKDDCFTVRCDIIVLGKARVGDTAPDPPAFVPPPPDLPEHFRTLLHGGLGVDVEFLIEGKTFAAHRCVLAARSPVFSAELYGAMKEGATTNVVQIDDMRADVFGNLLHFIYTDSLPEPTAAEGEEEATSMAQHLLVAADRYGMERLKLICEDKLCKHIGLSSVANTLMLAEQHHCQRLKDMCFDFICALKKLDMVVETDGFQYLAKSCPFVLFELITKLGAGYS